VFRIISFKSSHLLNNVKKNFVKPGRLYMTIWRMRISFWTTKTTNTHSQFVIIIVFPIKLWLQDSATSLRSTYIAHHQAHSILQVCERCRLLFLSKQATSITQMSPQAMLYQFSLHSLSADTNHAIPYFACCFCKFTLSCAAPL
jgi:hypothetical protein